MMAGMLTQLPLPLLSTGAAKIAPGVGLVAGGGGLVSVHGLALLPAGFKNSATCPDLGLYAARSYSLMRPPRRGWRWIRFLARSAGGWSGRGGRS